VEKMALLNVQCAKQKDIVQRIAKEKIGVVGLRSRASSPTCPFRDKVTKRNVQKRMKK
jgi:hypothetical protein